MNFKSDLPLIIFILYSFWASILGVMMMIQMVQIFIQKLTKGFSSHRSDKFWRIIGLKTKDFGSNERLRVLAWPNLG